MIKANFLKSQYNQKEILLCTLVKVSQAARNDCKKNGI